MYKENQLEMNNMEDTEATFTNIGKMSINDFLFLIAGVGLTALFTVLLSWMIM